jgi:hypothetical protein
MMSQVESPFAEQSCLKAFQMAVSHRIEVCLRTPLSLMWHTCLFSVGVCCLVVWQLLAKSAGLRFFLTNGYSRLIEKYFLLAFPATLGNSAHTFSS